MGPDTKLNLLDLSIPQLHDFLEVHGETRYRAQQILQWMHQRGVRDVASMTNLSKKLRSFLAEFTEIRLPEIVLKQQSDDGTLKWLLKLTDGNVIETVFIPEPDRGTLCISSQAGCALNCSFCATGKEGFNRNLLLGEMMAQIFLATHELEKCDQRITNVVFMGMGEPLLNYDVVIATTHLLLSDYAYGLSKYHVTVSTAGCVPAMQRLREDSPVSLAVSLHAPNDILRNELVPLNKKYPLAVLMDACRHYFTTHRRRIMFEYVMLDHVNDSLKHADELIVLLENIPSKINLIPFNDYPGSSYQRSSDASIERFQNRLISAGFLTHVRRTRGQDISGACGQLAGVIRDRTGRHQRWLKTGRLVPESLQEAH